MKSKERLLYLTVILILVSSMSHEYRIFSEHYAALEEVVDYLYKKCDIKE